MELVHDLKRYKELYKECEKEKDVIELLYNEILEFTSPFATASTMSIRNVLRTRTINPTIYEASISFKNFVMSSLYGTDIRWAMGDVILPLLKKKFSGKALTKEVSRLRVLLDGQTESVFDYIHNTNYKQQIGRSIMDWGELGTGCFEIIEQDSNSNPFTFSYVGPNEYLFKEDSKGEPNIVFRKVFDKTLDELKEIYKNATFPEEIYPKETGSGVTIIECVVVHYEGTEKTFEKILFDVSLEHVLNREIIEYNPYTIFRFSIIPNTSWGIGIGLMSLDAYERIVFYENLRARQALRIVDPPLLATGDKRLLNGLILKPNEVNYGGDGRFTMASVFPINTTGTLLPIDTDIQRLEQKIQSLHFNNPFGNAENKTTRATNEIQYRVTLLQEKFDDAVNNLFEEVLIPSFDKPRTICLERNLVDKVEEDQYFKPKFVNVLTKTMDAQKIEKLLTFKQVIGQLYPGQSPFVLNYETGIPYTAEKMDIQDDLINSTEVIAKKETEAMQNSIALQRIANVADQGMDMAQTGGIQNE